jgi:hypothetical protein
MLHTVVIEIENLGIAAHVSRTSARHNPAPSTDIELFVTESRVG